MALYTTNFPTTTDSGVGGKRFRAGQVWGLTDTTITLRLYLEANIVGERTCARVLSPHSIVGDAKVAEVQGDGADSYVVVALHDAPGGDNDSVARGELVVGGIPPELSGERPRLHWASGLLRG